MREKLIELLCKAHGMATDESLFEDASFAQQLETEVDHLIANGVTIPARCKDCKKRYNPKECPMCVRVYGEQHDVTNDDGYCDYGERKTDA